MKGNSNDGSETDQANQGQRSGAQGNDEQRAGGKVRLTATTAVFSMSAKEAAIMVCYLQSQAAQDHGATGHPYKSLTAVRRKLEALEASEPSATAPSSPLAQKAPKALAELLRLDSTEE